MLCTSWNVFDASSRRYTEVEFQFDDPKTFTKQWGGKKIYQLENTGISEYIVCEEELQMGKSRAVR